MPATARRQAVAQGEGESAPDLPAELVVHMAKSSCTAPLLTTISALCHSWRAAIAPEGEVLWQMATIARFPRVKAILAAAPSALSWLEIYQLQLRSEKHVAAPEPSDPDPSDFVVSFELTLKGEVVLGETDVLPDEQANDDALCTKELWTEETAPKWIQDGWDEEWAEREKPTLSLWITRDVKTIQIYDEETCFDGEANEKIYYPNKDLALGVLLQVDFCEQTGRLLCWHKERTGPNDDEQSMRSMTLRALASMFRAI